MKVTYRIYKEKFTLITNCTISFCLLAVAADYILAFDLYDYASFVDRGFKNVCMIEDIVIINTSK